MAPPFSPTVFTSLRGWTARSRGGTVSPLDCATVGIQKRASTVSNEIRQTLFGDMSLNQWPGDHVEDEPWTSFVRARDALAAGDATAARHLWQAIISRPSLESRHHLQAWHFLREVGVEPEEDVARQLLGVVVEVPMGSGLDLLAVYADKTARYFNHAGSAVVWDRPDSRVDEPVGALLAASQTVVDHIGPWSGERPEAPQPGRLRLNFLTPQGLRFGEGPFNVLASDPMAGPVVRAALILLETLTQMDEH